MDSGQIRIMSSIQNVPYYVFHDNFLGYTFFMLFIIWSVDSQSYFYNHIFSFDKHNIFYHILPSEILIYPQPLGAVYSLSLSESWLSFYLLDYRKSIFEKIPITILKYFLKPNNTHLKTWKLEGFAVSIHSNTATFK